MGLKTADVLAKRLGTVAKTGETDELPSFPPVNVSISARME